MPKSRQGITNIVPRLTKSKLISRYRYYSKLSYIHNPGTEPLRYLTIGNILEDAASHFPETQAVVSLDQNKTYTYQKLLEEADKVAAGLLDLGLERGDRVGLWCPNLAEWVTLIAACARAGLILVGINPAYQSNELEHCLKSVGVKGIICPDKVNKFNFYDILSDVVPQLQKSEPGKISCSNLPSLKTVITISDDVLRGTYNYTEVLEHGSDTTIKNIQKNQHRIQPDDIVNIQFTSGTTGTPKASCLTHFSIVNNSYFNGIRNELHTKHHKICVQVPFFHCFGTVVAIGGAFHYGATLVLPSPTYNALKNLKAIESEKCTVICGTPTMYVDLIDFQNKIKADINPDIAITGGSPCSPKLFKNMQNVLKVKRLKSIYGMTEMTSVAFQNLPIAEDDYKVTNTVGYIGDHLEAKIVDDNGETVPIGMPGELWVRGYSTMQGYWNDIDKTAEIIQPDGWLKTGDQFILQEDGYGRIIGRIKDMIIRGGENIFPKEVEDFINTHPDVLESYVIGLKDERLGEQVCACIRVKKGCQFTYESLVGHCKGKIANFKIPGQMVIMDSFPKTTSGKIQKYLLKEQVKQLL